MEVQNENPEEEADVKDIVEAKSTQYVNLRHVLRRLR